MHDETILLETDSNLFPDDIIKLIMKKYNDIEEKIEGSRFSFTFSGSLGVRCDNVNVTKGSSNSESPKWLRYKNATINSKSINDGCSVCFCPHTTP